MARTDLGVEIAERTAASAIMDLGESIQDALYYRDERWAIPPVTEKALTRAYRVLKRYAEYYYGADFSRLIWEPPSGKFKRKKTENNSLDRKEQEP